VIAPVIVKYKTVTTGSSTTGDTMGGFGKKYMKCKISVNTLQITPETTPTFTPLLHSRTLDLIPPLHRTQFSIRLSDYCKAFLYHGTMDPITPIVTSVAPSMLCRLMGRVKNGSAGLPINGPMKNSADSHIRPPIKRKPKSLIKRSMRREPLVNCLCLRIFSVKKSCKPME